MRRERMLKNSVYAKSIISFICVTFVISIFLFLGENAKTEANAKVEKAKFDAYNRTKGTVGNLYSKINNEMITLGQYFAIRTGIVNMLAENNEDIRDNALNATSLEGAISALGLNLLDKMDGVTLKNQLDGANASIEKIHTGQYCLSI